MKANTFYRGVSSKLRQSAHARTCECENATGGRRSLISSYVTFMDTASEYAQGRDISMPAKGAFPQCINEIS